MPSNSELPPPPDWLPEVRTALSFAEARQFLGPRYWTTWLILGLAVLLAQFPFRLQLAAGRALGRLGQRTIPKHRRVVEANIRLCFPGLAPAEQAALVRAHFESLGMALPEMALAWLARPAKIARHIVPVGVEHLREAYARGKGVILVSAHFTAMELTVLMLFALGIPISGVYRRNKKNPLIDRIVHNGRGRFADVLIDRDDVRRMIEVAKAGGVVFFTSDHLVKPSKRSYLVPFFGEPALTHSGLTDLARMTGSAVVPFLPMRIPGTDRYELRFLPAFGDFPSGDRLSDMARFNALLEARILEDPCQYYWINKRFARRPPPWPDPYAKT